MTAYLPQLGALLALLLGGVESHHRRGQLGPSPFAAFFFAATLAGTAAYADPSVPNPFLAAALSLAIITGFTRDQLAAAAGLGGVVAGAIGFAALNADLAAAAAAAASLVVGALLTFAAYAALTHLDALRSPPIQAGLAVTGGALAAQLLAAFMPGGITLGGAADLIELAISSAAAGAFTGAYLGQDLHIFRGEGALGLTPSILWVPAARLQSPFARIFWESPQPSLVIDSERQVVLDANLRACELFGADRAALADRPVGELFEDALERVSLLANAAIQDADGPPQQTALKISAIKATLIRADGERLDTELHLTPLSMGGRALKVVALHDTTRRAHEREQLIRAERLDVVERFASGVAHDFNNLLQGILGYAEHLSPGSRPSELRQGLGTIRRYAERGAELSRAMQELSRDREKLHGTADCAAAVENLRQALERAFPRALVVEARVEMEDAFVPLPARRLEELLFALATNAREAMPDGGTLSIDVVADALLSDGDVPCVKIVVRDTGGGFSRDMLRVAFEPYTSTREGAPGMGLAVVYSVVTGAGGEVWIRSSKAGSEVQLRLPKVERPPKIESSLASRPAPVTDRVLVVDDEEDLRDMIETLLMARGFDVIQASDGVEALEVLDADQRFDAILLDMVMPNLDGAGVLRALIARGCEIPVVLSTGYSPEELAPECRHQITSTLRKPFLAADLYAAIDASRRPVA